MSDDPSPDPTPALDSVWVRPVLRRGRPGTLTREQVIAGAVALLDASGTAGLTMRSLARRLGQSTMAIYHYVATRDDLLELAVDAVLAGAAPRERDARRAAPARPTDATEPGGPARERLIDIAEAMFQVFVDHAWVAGILGSRPPLGPNAQANLRAVVEAFTAAGLGGPRLDGAVTAFYYYVLGAAGGEAAFAVLDPAVTGAMLAWTSQVAGRDDAALVDYLGRMAQRGSAGRFRTGLDLVLDAALR